MAKEFNITGLCVPNLHYMVDIATKIKKISKLVEDGKYLTISRPRQFGKTTTLNELFKSLQNNAEYVLIDTSFEGLGAEAYQNDEVFIRQFIRLLSKTFKFQKCIEYIEFIGNYPKIKSISDLSDFITELSSINNKKLVLLIDEVDKSMNNQLFLDFLGMLRNKYLDQAKGTDRSFHSVVLAGVHDVKTMKLKINPDTELKYNSPWNIAADIDVDMSFNPDEISTMLVDYINDKNIEMDNAAISRRIYYYTSGYPFLVSRICKEIDEKIMPLENKKVWNINNVEQAIKIILQETNTNFENLIKTIENNDSLFHIVEDLILGYRTINFVVSEPTINMANMFGIIKKNPQTGKVTIHNKMYEEYITDYIIAKFEINSYKKQQHEEVIQSSYIKPNGRLNIDKVLYKFQEVIKEKYSKSDVLKSSEFLEKDMRLLFLVFLKPIINGIGFSFKEVETSEEKRLDIVIIFRDEKFIIELKLWRGQEYHREGVVRLIDYMERESVQRGFMLIMDKTRHKEFSSNTEDNILMVWI